MFIFDSPLKKTLSTIVGVTALISSAGGFAASVDGVPQTASATVIFTDPVQFTHTLTAVDNLQSGEIGSLTIATGTVVFSSGTTERVAYTFGEGSELYGNGGFAIKTTLKGTNNPDNTFNVYLTGDGDWKEHAADSLIPYAYASGPVTNNRSEYAVESYMLQGVKADSYTISVTAYGYTS